jgi:pyrroloquinoline quinone biosynthesis protein B
MDRRTRTVFVAVALLVALIPLTAGANEPAGDDPFVVVLGIAQDGGYPQTGCRKDCCRPAWEDPARRRYASCIAIVDPRSSQRWIVDATPDFREQLRLLDTTFPVEARPGIDGFLLSHAHVGHYTGLMLLGREVMGTKNVPVYAMPRMYDFLQDNGPWNQLVRLGNIELRPLSDGTPVALNDRITVTPFLVPHRDEYTETAGFRIDGPKHSVLYISDIDKWHVWEKSIVETIAGVSVAYVDATFYAEGEIPGRNMADIPHPFIQESMALFEPLPAEQKAKIRFIHLNHTNPALIPGSDARAHITGAGFAVAEQSETAGL